MFEGAETCFIYAPYQSAEPKFYLPFFLPFGADYYALIIEALIC